MDRMLPVGWVTCNLSELITEVRKIERDADKETQIEYVDISAIDNQRQTISFTKTFLLKDAPSRAKQVIESGDVLFSLVRPYLKNIAAVPSRLNNQVASTGFCVLRPSFAIDKKFLFFKVVTGDFINLVSGKQYGVSYPAVKEEQIKTQLIDLPPLNEQKRIVAKIEELFSELDNGITSLKAAREQLKVYRQAVLKHAFEGKLTAKWRDENADKLESPEQLLVRIQEERNARYQQQLKVWKAAMKKWEAEGKEGKKPSKPKVPEQINALLVSEVQDLYDLPSGWIFLRLGNFIENIDAGKSFKCDEREPASNEVGVAKVSAVTWGEYDESESKTCLDESMINTEFFIKREDFILSRANTIELVGACVITKEVTKPIMLSDKTLRINFNSIGKEYVLQYLRSYYGRNEIMGRSTGNQESMRNIGQDRIKSIVIPVCSNAEMELITSAINEHLDSIFQLSNEIELQISKAETLRQSILKKAFSGQLVPHDPNDEPASELLARIRATKSISKGK